MTRHSQLTNRIVEFQWSTWRPLTACWADRELSSPGLYRIRRSGREVIDYIGQTGGALRARLRMLQGIEREEMPYRDPHTVGPALWAQRQLTGEPYEASTCAVDGDSRWRKALEAIATALYRQQHGRSPTFNFGRMPSGYRMSTGNNARLVASGKRFRGGPRNQPEDCHLPSLPPAGPLSSDYSSPDWCGHRWTEWVQLEEVINGRASGPGLYRTRGGGGDLVYVGEGVIASRLPQHWRTAQLGSSPQGQVFAAGRPLTCSWVVNASCHTHQRLEFETDLIAAYALAEGRAPAGQFIT